MQSVHVLIANGVIIAALMITLWVLSLLLKNASIVDIFWGVGFVVIAWTSWMMSDHPSLRSTGLCVLVTLWGLRLAAYLTWRNVGKGEDYRYGNMRRQRPGSFWIWSLLFVFGLQGALMWVVALPLQLVPLSAKPLSWLDVVGIVVWSTGWFLEAVSDWQLARFKARPENRGRVIQQGLWRYSRHPNYFGDFLVWWSFYFMAVAAGASWWTIVSPIIMSILLVRVSGVALLEKTIEQRRPEYAEYASRTSAFVPWPPTRSTVPEPITTDTDRAREREDDAR